jgi:hypothetical protein
MPIETTVGAFARGDDSRSTRIQAFSIEAWTEQVAHSTVAVSAPQNMSEVAPIVIPRDGHPGHKAVDEAAANLKAGSSNPASRSRHEPLRRDSLKRREALVKGHEGSRRRQRWENGWYQAKPSCCIQC